MDEFKDISHPRRSLNSFCMVYASPQSTKNPINLRFGASYFGTNLHNSKNHCPRPYIVLYKGPFVRAEAEDFFLLLF